MREAERVIHQKLVRDRIPEIIVASGRTPRIRSVHGDALEEALIAKLEEEANEFRDAIGDARREELADVLEVVRALAAHLGISMGELDRIADNKRSERGGFNQGIWLESVEDS